MNLDGVLTQRIPVGAVSIAIREWGSGDPLLLIHGLGTHSGLWRYQADLLGAHFRVVAVDLRGFGASDRPAETGAYRVESFVSDLVALAAKIGLGRFHCLGTSMGGFIAQVLALREPAMVRSLVLAHTAARMTIPADVLAARLDGLRRSSMEDYGRLVATQALARGVESPLFDWLTAMIAANDRRAYERVLTEGLTDFDERERLGGLKLPTLVLAGDTDRVIPPAASEDLVKRIPGAEFEMIPDAGHIGYAEQPAAFNRRVLEFVRGVP